MAPLVAYSCSWFFRLLPRASIRRFAVPTPNSYPESVAIGPDGNVWFTEKQGNKIGRISQGGEVSEFLVPTAASHPQGIVAGPDGNIWFTENRGNKIGRVTPSGEVLEYSLPTAESYPYGIAVGPDNALWFTLSGTDSIGRISLSGASANSSSLTPGLRTGLPPAQMAISGSPVSIATPSVRSSPPAKSRSLRSRHPTARPLASWSVKMAHCGLARRQPTASVGLPWRGASPNSRLRTFEH